MLIDTMPEAKRELLGFQVGVRNMQSWRELLVGFKAYGLDVAPEMAVGDGMMGF